MARNHAANRPGLLAIAFPGGTIRGSHLNVIASLTSTITPAFTAAMWLQPGAGPRTGEGELKLYGSAAPAGPEFRASATRAWWSEHPEQAAVFLLGIATALFIEWDLRHGVMTTHHWNPRNGHHRTRRYPRSAPAARRAGRCGLTTCRPGMSAPRVATRCGAARPRAAARRDASPDPDPAALLWPAAAVLARGPRAGPTPVWRNWPGGPAAGR